jgi:hypothetical protein
MAGGIRKAMVFAMLTIGFHMLVFFLHQPKGTFGKLFGLVPAVLVVAALLLKPVTSIMNFYYTQWHFVNRVSGCHYSSLLVNHYLSLLLLLLVTTCHYLSLLVS